MEWMKRLSTVIDHCEALAGEAEDLGDTKLAARIAGWGRRGVEVLEAALEADEAATVARARYRAQKEALSAANDAITHALRRCLPGDEARDLSPTALDVTERVGFRLRALARRPKGPNLEAIATTLAEELAAYEASVDDTLERAAEKRRAQQQAKRVGQAIRPRLAEAKAQLVRRSAPGSDQRARIRRRCVQTRPAPWLADTTRPDLRLGLSVPSQEVVNSTPAAASH